MMSKFYHITLSIIVVLTFKGCHAQNDIVIQQEESNLPIVLHFINDSVPNRLLFPIQFEITNRNSEPIRYVDAIYSSDISFRFQKGKEGLLFEGEQVDLNYNNRIINAQSKKSFYIYTNHPIQEIENYKELISGYIKQNDSDTIHLGTLKEIKRRNFELIENSLDNSEVVVSFPSSNKNSSFYSKKIKVKY